MEFLHVCSRRINAHTVEVQEQTPINRASPAGGGLGCSSLQQKYKKTKLHGARESARQLKK